MVIHLVEPVHFLIVVALILIVRHHEVPSLLILLVISVLLLLGLTALAGLNSVSAVKVFIIGGEILLIVDVPVGMGWLQRIVLLLQLMQCLTR